MTSGTTHIKTFHYKGTLHFSGQLVALRMTEKEGSTTCGEGCCQSSSEEGFLKWEEKAASGPSWN